MALNYVNLTVDAGDGSGTFLLGGFAQFFPTQLLSAPGVELFTQVPVTAFFRTGSPPVVRLLATDNAGVTPGGWNWTVTFGGMINPPATYTFALPFSGGANQNLSSVTVTLPSQSFSPFLPLPSGTPSSGQVPVATGAGEASAWGNVAANPMTTLGDTMYGAASGAVTRLAGDTSNIRKFLRELSSGGVAAAPAWDTIAARDVPTLNQNTTGTASNITGTLDQVPAPAANVSLNSKKITSLANGSAASDAAALGQAVAGILTTFGDLVYENAAPAPARLAGNTSATKNFLTQTGNGSASAAPAWGTIASGDLPVVSGQYLAAPVAYAPASPTNLQTTSATLAAVSSANVNTGSFTAPASGSVVVQADFEVSEATASTNMSFALAAHGTVTPVIGNTVTVNCAAGIKLPFSVRFVVTGLVAGNSYNLDLLFAVAGAATLTIAALGGTSTTPTGTIGAPVIMTVQAV